MGDAGATAFHTLTPQTRDLTKQQWDQERFGMLCTETVTFAEIKKIIEKLCDQTKNCKYDAEIQKFFENVESFDARIAELTR